MKHKFTIIIMTLAVIGAGLATQANAVTFTFQENGSNMSLGHTSTFAEGGFSLTATAFLTAGGDTNLFAKSEGPGEIGLGIFGALDNEITTSNFIQLTVPTTPPSNFQLVIGGSVSGGEQMDVFFTPTSGTLTGATLIGSITGTGGSVTVPANFQSQSGFIDVTSANNTGNGNVLLASVTVGAIPEPGSVALLAIALAGAGIEGLRRTLRIRKASK